jgi:hypothetical protein
MTFGPVHRQIGVNLPKVALQQSPPFSLWQASRPGVITHVRHCVVRAAAAYVRASFIVHANHITANVSICTNAGTCNEG